MKPNSMVTQFGTPSSSSFTHKHSWTYDVFLSFRGQDTRRNFTDHLYSALSQQGINTFDNVEVPKGEVNGPAIFRAIEESRISIIILSHNYATSRWCLEELVKILGCRNSKQQQVLPVFYKVSPADVRNLTGRFGEALAAHEIEFKDKIYEWRAALMEVAYLSGWHFPEDGFESKFIHGIVEEISKRVHLTYLHVADYPVGIESRIRDMDRLVGVGGDDIRMVGIWGPGGIGKTTIAKAVYNSIIHKFECSCFLENIRERSAQYGGLVKLQRFFLSHILMGKEIKLATCNEGMTVIKERLSHKRVLLVLDDVNDLEQLRILAGGSQWFGLGSRVIITTRDKHLLIAHQVNLIYKVKTLDHHEAFELFSYNCFPKKELSNESAKLAIDAVQYAQGLPLALVALGSVLCGRSIEEWKEARDGNWQFGITGLYDTLKISIDALEHQVREVFLDIACFFRGENNNHVIQLLKGGGFNPNISLSILQEKAVISINEESHIWMHNLVEVIGKRIVHIESPNEPCKRSRLWSSDDVYDVLTKGKGTNKVKGIMVKLPEPDEIVLSAASFSRMKNLKYFINCNASFSGNIDCLPDELRLIDWPAFPFESLPINFIPRKLVKLSMPRSCMSQLGERFKHSKTLKYINLESCPFLTEIPNLSGFPNLRHLNLSNCTALVELDDSIGFLNKLVFLSLSGCRNITKFPRRIALKSAKHITLRGCRMLESFPTIVKRMECLTSLDLSGTAIKELPSQIASLISLEELTIRECDNLTTVPFSIYDLQNLGSLDLQGCSKLVSFPKWMLEELPELPPKVKWVNAADCLLLERFTKLSNILEHRESQMIKCVSLLNCQRLCGSLANKMEEIEDTLLNEVTLCSLFLSCKQSEFNVVFPGAEVPKWFNHWKYLSNPVDTSEFSFEIPLNFKLGDKGLAICAVATSVDDLGHCAFTARISIQEESSITRSFSFEAKEMVSAHVWLLYIPLVNFAHRQSLPFTCRVTLEHTSQGSARCKSYGVHLVMPQGEYDDYMEDDYSVCSSSEDDKSNISDRKKKKEKMKKWK
ncbi:disease resistance protein RPV1-like isoform X2 [Rosa chinensis]|uniref:disease resistance protein RPV1-like isoform X2 n=1 Tax=Rosa chinensis TaxID=74649 RepID=UPI001AD9304C|nr:disease resistance protein RPV1-like isoform X2 [Rosa chinensis]